MTKLIFKQYKQQPKQKSTQVFLGYPCLERSAFIES